jgi:PST family polysaccharide transporter
MAEPDTSEMPSPTMRDKIASGTTSLALARIVTRSFDLITFIVLTRCLVPADFGLVAISLSIVQITEAVLEIPTSQVLLRLQTVTRLHYSTAFTLGLMRGVAITVILAALAFPLARFFNDDRLIALIAVQALAPAVRGLRSPRFLEYYKALQFGQEAIADTISKGIALAVSVTIAIMTQSYWAIAMGTVTAPVFYVAVSYVVAPFRPTLTLSHVELFRRYLGWGMAAQLVSAINWQCDRFVLARLVSHSTLGLFTAARDLAAIGFKVMFDIINRPVMAALSVVSGDLDRLSRAYAKVTDSTMSLGLPLACGQALIAPELVRLVMGPNWTGAISIFQFVSLAIIPMLFTNLTSTVFYAAGRPELVFNRYLLDLIFRVPVTVALILLLGLEGAVIAFILSEVFMAAICIRSVKRILGISIIDQLVQPRRAIVGVGVMAIVVETFRWALPPISGLPLIFLFLASAVPLAAITYVAAHLVAWQLEGRPDGIERFALTLLNRRFRRFFSKA